MQLFSDWLGTAVSSDVAVVGMDNKDVLVVSRFLLASCSTGCGNTGKCGGGGTSSGGWICICEEYSVA